MRRIGDVMADMGNPESRGAHDPYAGGVMTKQGWLSWADIEAAGGRFVNDENGNRVLQFPTWDKERGTHYRTIPDWKLEEGKR